MIELQVAGSAVPQGSLRAHMAGGRPVLHYTNQEPLALWRDAVASEARRQGYVTPRPGPFGVSIDIRVKRPQGHLTSKGTVLPRFTDCWPDRRPDIDKLARSILDALTGLVWRDDGQVVILDVAKRYADTPSSTITITAL
jgi:crossover junction endodeoxyribonuclease RusA